MEKWCGDCMYNQAHRHCDICIHTKDKIHFTVGDKAVEDKRVMTEIEALKMELADAKAIIEQLKLEKLEIIKCMSRIWELSK